MMIEEAEDVGDQGSDAAKASRADDFGGDFAKEASTRLSQEEEAGMKWR